MVWKGLGGCVLPEQWQDGEQEATEPGAIDPGPVLLYQCFPRLSQEAFTCGLGVGRAEVDWGGVAVGRQSWQQLAGVVGLSGKGVWCRCCGSACEAISKLISGSRKFNGLLTVFISRSI